MIKKILIFFTFFILSMFSYVSFSLACSIVATPPADKKEYILSEGKNIKIPNRQTHITIRAQGNNIVCGSGLSIRVIATGRDKDYTINLAGSSGDHVLDSSVPIRSLNYSSSSKSRVDLGGTGSFDLSRKLTISTGVSDDSIQVATVYKNLSINSGGGKDVISVSERGSGSSTDIKSLSGDNKIDVSSSGRAPDNIAIETGAGDDLIEFKNIGSGADRRSVKVGAGNDIINSEAGGKNTFLLSLPNGGSQENDQDRFFGGPGEDDVQDFAGSGNLIRGGGGSDRLYSGGKAQSRIYGDNGNDQLFSEAGGDSKDEVYGGRNNDAINCPAGKAHCSDPSKSAMPGNISLVKGAIIDGGPGDDMVRGTKGDDIFFYRAGIKNIFGGVGDDTVIRNSVGRGIINGESGRDTISYMLHAYSSALDQSACANDQKTGVRVILFPDKDNKTFSRRYINDQDESGQPVCKQQKMDTLSSFEDLVGSVENDFLAAPAKKGTNTNVGEIQSLYGKDQIITSANGFETKKLINNFEYGTPLSQKSICRTTQSYYYDPVNQNYAFRGLKGASCNTPRLNQSPHNIISSGGAFISHIQSWPVIIGGSDNNRVVIKDRPSGGYFINSNFIALVKSIDSGDDDCWSSDSGVICKNLRKQVLIHSGGGNDFIQIEKGVSESLLSVINSGPGNDTVRGGDGDDFITSSYGNSTIESGDGADHVVMVGRGTVSGGGGPDVFNVRQNPCYSGSIQGGDGTDIVVFVGGDSGVLVDYGINTGHSRFYDRRSVLNEARFQSGWGIAYQLGPVVNNPVFGISGIACPINTNPLELSHDIEDLEGTSSPDYFIGSQSRPLNILTRQGEFSADEISATNKISIGDMVWVRGNGQLDRITVAGPPQGPDLLQADATDSIQYCWGDAKPPEFESLSSKNRSAC